MSTKKDPKQKGALQEKAANWFRRRQTGGGHKKIPWDKKQSNWDYLQNQDPQDTNKYRDVYSDQQLERSKIERTQTFATRRILMIIVAVFVSILLYVVSSGVSYLAYSVGNSGGGSVVVEGYDPTGKTKPYVQEVTLVDGTKYFALDSPTDTGLVNDKRVYYDKKEDVPPPAWYKALEAEYQKKYAENKEEIEKAQKEHAAKSTFGYHLFPRVNNALPALLGGLLLYGIMYPIMRRNYEAQTILERTDDINQYANDRHVALPEEILQHPEFDIFPDVGATSNVQISSLISHFMLSNKGLDPLPFTQRAEKDIVDEDGDILYYKGEALRDEDGNVMAKMMPRIDEAFGEALYKASNQPKEVRKYWDVSSIPYNEGDKYRDRQGGNIKTIGELINKDWQLPWYEPQRPAGFYLCDVAPVNTMVLAITRAGKGQTYIEPFIDMLLRERRPNNIVINDPKGELLSRNYVPATMRGFEVVQFNLINVMNTDIYNPLLLAAQSARENDFTKAAMYVENIADVFFPVEGADDPVWPNA